MRSETIRRAARGEDRRTTWLELAFDLVFVAAVAEIAEELEGDLTGAGVARFVVQFVLFFLTWSDTTRAINHLVGDDTVRRLLVFVQVVAYVHAALLVSTAPGGWPLLYAGALAVGRAALLADYLRGLRSLPEARTAILLEAGGAVLGVVSLALAALTGVRVVLLAAIAGSLLGVAGRSPDEQLPAHPEHLRERYGLFALIVLGDAITEIVDHLAEQGMTVHVLFTTVAAIAVAAGLWWAYFEDAERRLLSETGWWPHRWPTVWLGVHLLLTAGLTAFAAGVGTVVRSGLGLDDTLAARDVALLGGALAATLAGLAVVSVVETPRRAGRPSRRLVGAGVALAVVAVGAGQPLGLVLGALLAAVWLAAP